MYDEYAQEMLADFQEENLYVTDSGRDKNENVDDYNNDEEGSSEE